MARPIFGTRNFIDDATMSGGSWQATLPVTNVQDRRLAKLARSSTDSVADAQMLGTLSAARMVRAAGLFGHNISLAGKVRFSAYDDQTFTRAGIASYHDSQGIVRSAASGEIRRGHYIGGVRTTLPEEARTNICLQSEVLATTWVNTRTTDGANVTTAPDGNVTADSLIEDGTASSTHYIAQAFTKAASALAYSFSVYLKAGTRDHASLFIAGTSFANRVGATFHLADGSLHTATSASGDFTIGVAGTEVLDDGWVRCWVTCTSNTDTDLNIQVNLHDGSSSTYSGDSDSRLFVWGSQLEQAASPSSYIATTTIAVARVVDVLYQAYAPVPQEATYLVEFVELGTIDIATGAIMHIGSATASSDPRLTVTRDTSTAFYEVIFDNSTAFVSATLAVAPAIGDTVVLRVTLNKDGSIEIGQKINGDAETTATASAPSGGLTDAGSAWADTRLYINSAGTSTPGVNAFVRAIGQSGVKTTAEMEALEKGDLHTYAPADTGWVNPYEVFPTGVLEDGHPAFGTTTLSSEEFADGYPVPWVVSFPAAYGRYLKFEIDDTANADTWLNVGRAFCTYGYKPSHGISVGMRIGYQTESRRKLTDGGAAFHNAKPQRRRFDFMLSQFLEDESLVYLFEVDRKVGTDVQMMLVLDPDATKHMHRLSGLFTLERLRPLAFARTRHNDKGFTAIEEI